MTRCFQGKFTGNRIDFTQAPDRYQKGLILAEPAGLQFRNLAPQVVLEFVDILGCKHATLAQEPAPVGDHCLDIDECVSHVQQAACGRGAMMFQTRRRAWSTACHC